MMDEETRQRTIDAIFVAMQVPEEFMNLAQAMAYPIMRRINYAEFGRNAFKITPIPPEQIAEQQKFWDNLQQLTKGAEQ